MKDAQSDHTEFKYKTTHKELSYYYHRIASAKKAIKCSFFSAVELNHGKFNASKRFSQWSKADLAKWDHNVLNKYVISHVKDTM